MRPTILTLASCGLAAILAPSSDARAQVCAERHNMTVYMALDASSSMAGTNQAIARDFSVLLLDQLGSTGFVTEAGAFVFCREVMWDPPWLSASQLRNELLAWTSTCSGTADGTSLYGAIVLASSVIRARSSPVKLLVVVTDGEDTTSVATLNDAVSALRPPGIIARLVFVGPGSATLDAIAAAAGQHVRSVAANTGNITSLVYEMVNATCANFYPVASFTLSDAELRLGRDGFNITFNGAGSWDDGSIAEYRWRFTRPDGTTFERTGSPQVVPFDDTQLPFGETWTVRLIVKDNRGFTDDEQRTFRVIGSSPEIAISGSTSIDALGTIQLSASPTTDIDGGNLTFVWDLLASPPMSTHQPQSGFATGATLPALVTTEADIGAFRFRVTATDNEGQTGAAEATVTVRNLPPRIDLVGEEHVDVETPIHVETQAVEDPDGGALTYRWDVVQAPQRAPIGVQVGYATTPAINIPTARDHAGTWVFKLTVTDNEGPGANPPGQATAEYTVLVDADPEVAIAVRTVAGAAPGDPATVRGGTFPLVIDGSASEDPDSPCPGDPAHCHATDGRAPTVSAGIVTWRWSLIDVPPALWGEIPLGPVDEALGLDGNGPILSIDHYLTLGDGQFTFKLEVLDAEGNYAASTQQVVVVPPNTPPVALASAPARHVADATGVMLADVTVSGAASFDPDNLLAGGLGPGAGITAWNWTVAEAPPGCTPPAIGASASTATLYAASAVVPLACFGHWRLALTVTDDDTPALTGTATVDLLLGNCPGAVCIDYPTAATPQLVEFTDATDVTIFYHLDAGVYASASLISGLFAQLEILRESDPLPFWADVDPNPLATSLGGFTVFHWNGYGFGNQRPPPGRYTVRIALLDYAFTSSAFMDEEVAAIQLATAEPVLLPTSDDLASRDALDAGGPPIAFRYQVTGAAHPDQLRLVIRDGGSAERYARTDAAAGTSGTLTWDGRVAGALVAAGAYTAEVVALRGGAALGTSARRPFQVIRSDLDVDTDRDAVVDDTADEAGEDAWTKARGAIFAVNMDRDGTRVDGAGRPLPDTVHVDDSGTPVAEDLTVDGPNDVLDLTAVVFRGLGSPLPPGVTVVLVAAELEDVQSMHLFKRPAAGETAIWGGLGSRVGQPAQPVELDVTRWVNPGSPDFVGLAPGGDVTFALEGLFFRSTGAINSFDGELDLRLEVRRGGAVLFSDAVRLKVAPWIMLPHTVATTDLWTGDFGAWNLPFRSTAAADPGYRGLDDSGQLRLAPELEAQDQWIQDHVETGYTQRPGAAPVIATVRLPHQRGPDQPAWPWLHLLGGEGAVLQMGGNIGTDADGTSSPAGSFGGNLELLPPTATHQLGRVVYGDTMSPALRIFLESQEVQAPVALPTRWLEVGHVDEYVGYTTTPGVLLAADPAGAWAVMNAIAPADRGRAVFFATGALPRTGTVSALPAAPDRLETGVNLTGAGWQWVRIYKDAGSGAAGQVARVATLANGYLQVSRVWDTGSKVLPGGGAANVILDNMMQEAPAQATWFRPPGPGDAYVLVEGTRFWFDELAAGSHGTPAVVTVEEVLADADLSALNLTDAVGQIAAGTAALQAAAGGGLTFLKVPVIFVGQRAGFATARSGLAFTPDLANGQLAAGRFYLPRQFGPRNAAGEDLFEKAARAVLPTAQFVDDWDPYHRLMGEVHCGSSAVRGPLPVEWWSHQP